jgi:hypothetical protein
MKDVVFYSFILFYSLIKISKTFFANSSKHHNLRQYHLMYVSGVWVLNHLPLIDFRPFKVGANIQKEWKFLKVRQSLS